MSYREVRGAAETSGDRLSPYSTQLTELELASGTVLGEDPDTPPLPEVDPRLDPLEALGQAMIPLLERPPCLVAFSGGRDSAAVLAVAAAVARREGLGLPIPITQRFPHAPDAEESRWQELVIRHLRLSDWLRRTVTDELDWIGPVARECLLAHGVLYPANSFFALPMLREARGGVLLTGGDGDSLLRVWRWERARSVLSRRVRPTPRDALRIGLALAPDRVRAWNLRKQKPLDLPWLDPDAREVVQRRFRADLAGEPFRWSERVAWLSRQRHLILAVRSLDLIADGTEAAIAHPFLAPRFLAALAHAGRAFGLGDGTSVMRNLFGSLLPSEVVARTDKAGFGEVFWESHSRKLIAMRGERPASIEFVDERGLLEHWRQGEPSGSSAGILQALWLDAHRTSKESSAGPPWLDRDTDRR